ncbi:MAG: hypothetical protein NTZ64_18735 [Polaromonas sp.]|nr:hypothetical protein [Polaromonas sp.]
MSDSLNLKLQFSGYGDTCDLEVKVTAGAFTGCISAGFSESSLLQFAEDLISKFPFQPDQRIAIHGTSWDELGLGIAQRHVALTFYSIGLCGMIGCRVTLGTCEAERPEYESSLDVEIKTDYESLRAFGEMLKALLSRKTDEAILVTAN